MLGQSKDLVCALGLLEQNNNMGSTFHKKLKLVAWFKKKLTGSISEGRVITKIVSKLVVRLIGQSTIIAAPPNPVYVSLTLSFHYLTQKQHCEHVLAALEETMI